MSILNASRRAMTLVELLIVVTIVLLLAGLLVPALADAIALAHQIECANNLKQIGFAVHAYARHHDGRFPPSSCPSAGHARDQWWLHVLQEYAGTTLLYRCPSDRAPDEAFLDWENPPEDDWQSYRWASYATNSRMDQAVPYLSQVRDACRTIYVCEAALATRGADHVHPELWLSEQDLRNAVDTERHSGRSNALFVDSHVQAMTLEETWAPGKVNLWNPLRAPEWCSPMAY